MVTDLKQHHNYSKAWMIFYSRCEWYDYKVMYNTVATVMIQYMDNNGCDECAHVFKLSFNVV